MPSPEQANRRVWIPWATALVLLLSLALGAQVLLPRLDGLWAKGDPGLLTELGYTCTLILLAQGVLLARSKQMPLPLGFLLCLPSALLALLLAALGGAGQHARTFLALPPVLFLLFCRRPRLR